MVSLTDHRVIRLLGDLTVVLGLPVALSAEGIGYMLYSQVNPDTEKIHDRMIPMLDKPTDLRSIIQWLEARIDMVKLRNGAQIDQRSMGGMNGLV